MGNRKSNLHRKKISAVKIGMFDLGNGKFATKLKKDVKVRSVVAIVDEEQNVAYGLCPAYLMTCWCPTCLGVTTQHIISGMEATRLLLSEAEEKKIELPAVRFCADYEGYGVKKGEAFLPSKTEIRKIKLSAERIFSSWRQVGKHNSDWLALFTTTVNSDYCVWCESFSNMMVSGWKYQCRTVGVIPLVKIKF